ncbi:SDR family oxidoreductase [Dactylosporangium sp. CS-033363]|uniref:SDR family oxidoreductase n=1 Tax=Dactylosporangium sp. CS-033363 TaxID=3239935 RepID=UPI003D8AA8EE
MTNLVIGATGNVGRHVVAGLRSAGADVRAFSRTIAAGIDSVPGDLTEPDTLATALDGVETVFLLWRALPLDAAPPVVAAIAEAKHARRVVFLSSAAEDGPVAALHHGIEELIRATGLEWTFLRPAQFAANTMEWVPQIRAGDVVRGAHGDVPTTLIHERDIAAVAVRAMTGNEHLGRSYVLTGPEIRTPAELVPVIGEVIGRDLRWEEGTVEEDRARMLAWMPAAFVDAVLADRARRTPPLFTSTVEEVTGAPARTYREWVIEHTELFA